MVTRYVIQHRVVWYFKNVVLQFLQRSNTCHLFLGLWVAEDKVAESHVFLHQVVQVNVHLCRVLVDEMEALSLGLLLVGYLR